MFSSPDSSETGRNPGLKAVKALETSIFGQTCGLLSQYLKEKGSFGDLSLGMTCSLDLEGKGKPETFRQTPRTMNSTPNMEVSGYALDRNVTAIRSLKSMDLFPHHIGVNASASVEDAPKRSDFRTNKQARSEPENAQMTIFYAGQVIVFNDFPADKAKDVMILASKASSRNSNTVASSPADDQIKSNNNIPVSGSNLIPNNVTSNSTQDRLHRPPQSVVRDLPIARKASLHRFLEKRKDRINARAPYQSSNSAATTSTTAESKTWFGLASQSLEKLQL